MWSWNILQKERLNTSAAICSCPSQPCQVASDLFSHTLSFISVWLTFSGLHSESSCIQRGKDKIFIHLFEINKINQIYFYLCVSIFIYVCICVCGVNVGTWTFLHVYVCLCGYAWSICKCGDVRLMPGLTLVC